ncbi:MAG TPA: cyclic nucleotide-binding domain-containing protein [Candidatus Limnocylindrales bacterium]
MAPTNAKLELLRQVPLFAGCKNKALEQIEQLADEVDVPDGSTLIREGTFGEQFFLIVQGRVRIERGGQTIRILGPGEYLGEISLVDKGRTTATATTEGPARLFVLSHREFNSLLDQSPAIRAEIMNALARRVRQLDPNAPA